MLPGVFFFDKSKITPIRLKGTILSIGVLGSTITASAGVSTFNTYGNRCCSYNDKIFSFNYDGDMYIIDAISLSASKIRKAAIRLNKLRNIGSTCNKNYVYVVNGVSNGLLGTGILGTPSNNFVRYSIKDDKYSTINSVLSLSGDIGSGVIEGAGYIISGSTLYKMT